MTAMIVTTAACLPPIGHLATSLDPRYSRRITEMVTALLSAGEWRAMYHVVLPGIQIGAQRTMDSWLSGIADIFCERYIIVSLCQTSIVFRKCSHNTRSVHIVSQVYTHYRLSPSNEHFFPIVLLILPWKSRSISICLSDEIRFVYLNYCANIPNLFRKVLIFSCS